MAKATQTPAWQRALILLSGTVFTAIAVAALYWAQSVFVPLALALFFSFLLAPVVNFVQRRGIGRTFSVILVVTLASALFVGLVWGAGMQLASLVHELPHYTQNIKEKIRSVRSLGQGESSERLQEMVDDIGKELAEDSDKTSSLKDRPSEADEKPADSPVSVVVEPDVPPWMNAVSGYLTPLFQSLGAAALAFILVVFILITREDLRNRFLRLVGTDRFTQTTKAVDDAAQRLSRFLLMQAIVNGTYGLTLTIGLFLMGLPYALLWGLIAALLRYIPYIGAWIAAILPIGLSVATADGWTQPLFVIGLFIVLELVSNNVIEPLLYGKSMGVSEVALLISVAFWAFLWGPIGMVLSSPLTVLLVVLGRHVPHLEFLSILLGDEPTLDVDVRFYQRLLARDQDEAEELVEEFVKQSPPEELYDRLLIPALCYAKRDRENGSISEADEEFILRALREIAEDCEGQAIPEGAAPVELVSPEEHKQDEDRRLRVIACPARDEMDRLALEALSDLLGSKSWSVEIVPVRTLVAELLELIGESGANVICIASLPPGGLAHTRYLCKRLRARYPEMKILVGRWGLRGNIERNREQLAQAGADRAATTLLETRTHLSAWLPVLTGKQSKRETNEPKPAPANLKPTRVDFAHASAPD